MASTDNGTTQSSANENSPAGFAPSHWPTSLLVGVNDDEPDSSSASASLHTFALLGAAVAAADNKNINNITYSATSSATMAVDSTTGDSANNHSTFYPFKTEEVPPNNGLVYYRSTGSAEHTQPPPPPLLSLPDDTTPPTEAAESVGSGSVSLPGFTSPESAFYQYQNRMEGQLCQICGELAAGFHHGAYVCEACKASHITYNCIFVFGN